MKKWAKLIGSKAWVAIKTVCRWILVVLLSPFKAIHWLWKWLTAKPTFKITVTYDSKFGNQDDVVFENVSKIIKQTMKELVFETADKKAVNFKANSGLNYRIEEE